RLGFSHGSPRSSTAALSLHDALPIYNFAAMRIRLAAFLLILVTRPMPGLAQDSTGAPVDSLPGSSQSKGRVAWVAGINAAAVGRSEEHTSELQSREKLVCRLLLEKKK